jgi:cardiolipin synthase
VLRGAKKFIHIEYYIYEDGEVARAIEEVLVQKAREGVVIRFIYDDFGSRSSRRKVVRRLKAAGINIFPFYKNDSFGPGISRELP